MGIAPDSILGQAVNIVTDKIGDLDALSRRYSGELSAALADIGDIKVADVPAPNVPPIPQVNPPPKAVRRRISLFAILFSLRRRSRAIGSDLPKDGDLEYWKSLKSKGKLLKTALGYLLTRARTRSVPSLGKPAFTTKLLVFGSL